MSKIEHAVRGDAMRGLSSSGALERSGRVQVLLERSNRAKTSFGVDLTTDEGTDLLIAWQTPATCSSPTRRRPYEPSSAAAGLVAGHVARHTLAEWTRRLQGVRGQWAPIQSSSEVAEDAQTTTDDYIMELESADGVAFRPVTVPCSSTAKRPNPAEHRASTSTATASSPTSSVSTGTPSSTWRCASHRLTDLHRAATSTWSRTRYRPGPTRWRTSTSGPQAPVPNPRIAASMWTSM